MNDFLIVGGGIAGVSVAARLSHLGTVCVLEAEEGLGYHASGRSAALYEATYGKDSVVALNLASRDYLTDANGGVLSPRGIMLLCTKGDEAAFAADMKTLKLNPLNFAEAQSHIPILNPETVTAAGLRWDTWDIDTDRLIQNFAREARANGSVNLKARVTGISRQEGGWVVETAQGSFEGRILVNAAGAWVDEVARMAGVAPLGFQPYRRSIARIPAPGGHDVSKWPMMFGPGETWYAKPDAGKLLVSPAEEHPMDPHDAWADDMVLAEGLARYENAVTEPVTRMDSNWAGLRTFAPDRTLVIGFASDAPDFFWHAGQGGYGFQTSPAASRLAADVIGGTPPELEPAIVAALSPFRFAA
ncbi:FAD-binding oxidoreductase [Pseudoruegeria sp. HB172150]|uniref:NAD(P)/FAD-dependent oxidoreductase n=1 Tax=Pseudoruegeria sp. HB172150 TaxID=2721164 RepID=UPI00155322FB|nr:FAD-binding oxidoreductase [Pseudoruegeria sp. HB172150]